MAVSLLCKYSMLNANDKKDSLSHKENLSVVYFRF